MKAAFIAIAYVVTGKFVVSAFAMLLLTFMTDFAKIALAPITTFNFLMLLYFAVFSVVSARERCAFWLTTPSKALMIKWRVPTAIA